MTADRREFLKANAAVIGLTSLAPRRLLAAATVPARVVGPRVDGLDCPLGLDNAHPQFSWHLESAERGIGQSAYRIVVASSEKRAKVGSGDLWDSGKIASSNSVGIDYRGLPLLPRQRCWWRVQVWDELDRAVLPGPVSRWEMGLLSSSEWSAQWLLAEDDIAKADRETALDWVWGSNPDDPSARKFRWSFKLPRATKGGVLYCFGRNGAPQETITGIWLDGVRLGMGIPLRNLASEPIALGVLAEGRHCIAVQVELNNPVAVLSPEPDAPRASFGIAALARWQTQGSDDLRMASGRGWKTGISSDPDWFQLRYDDSRWEEVTTSSVEKSLIPDSVVHLRKEFTVSKPIRSARLYVSALGFYETRLNGSKVGDALLDPPPSEIGKHVLYRVYALDKLLQPGRNAMGLTVSGGWVRIYEWSPSPPQVIAQLEILYTDGTNQSVATGPDWKVSRGATVQSAPIFGETVDARLERVGWDRVGFNDEHWTSARAAVSPAVDRFLANSIPPIRVTQVLKPQAVRRTPAGAYLFDFGQAFAGWCRLHVKGSAGTRIDLRFAEELTSSGELDPFVLLGGRSIDTYILRGDPKGEIFEPRFTLHGIRYAEVTGLPAAPAEGSLLGLVVHSDLTMTGQFRIDSSLIERIWRNTVWTQRANCQGVPFLLPDRFNGLDAMGDIGTFWDAATFNMDVAALTREQMMNARDDQHANGAFSMGGPGLLDSPPSAVPVYSDGSVIVPWTNWMRYGDTGVIHENWDAMNRYLQFIADNNPDYVWRNGWSSFGDWLAVGEHHWYHPEQPPTTPLDLIATAYWANSADLLAQMAQACARSADAARLRGVWARVREAFIRTFVRPNGRVGNGSQACYILALKFGLLPEAVRSLAAQHLVADIRGRGLALSTGQAATQFSLDVLADAGFAEVVYGLLLRTEYPSWGYMIERGATTLWERWDGALDHRENEASHNYYTFGAICGFLFRRIAGIDAAEPGFRKIIVRPILDPLGRIKRAGADYDSVMGRISTDWVQEKGGGFSLQVSIPANTCARVYLPTGRDSVVAEGRLRISRSKDVRVVERFDRQTVVEIKSGNYKFFVRRASSSG